MIDVAEFYSNQILDLQKTIDKLASSSKVISLLRLITFVLIIGAIYATLVYSNYFVIIGLILISAFSYLVKLHSELTDRKILNNILLNLNENEHHCYHGEANSFDINPDVDFSKHIFANDLDIFGKLSLFNQINRTTTTIGKRFVQENLLDPTKDNFLINRRVEIIEELFSSVEWRQTFYALGYSANEKPSDIPKLKRWQIQPQFYKDRIHWLVVAGLLTISSVAIVFYMALESTNMYKVLVTIILVLCFNTFVYQIFFRTKINLYLSGFGDFSLLFNKWSELCKIICSKNLQSPLGVKITNRVKDAPSALRDISNLNKFTSYRKNNLSIFLLNGIFLFDLWYIFQIESWRNKYGVRLFDWIDSIAEIDFYNSLSNYKFNHPTFCNPQLLMEGMKISAIKMGHPLMNPGSTVLNDFEIGTSSNAHIITGSNMSGKSTFLRAIGLNMVLALNGLPVCAEQFSCSNLRIATCIRIEDSLEYGQSYFKAELNKLSTIIGLVKEGGNYLVLLDEILKGTNSMDRKEGTLMLYQRLSKFNCLALLATHDVEISHLSVESPKHFESFYFESYLDENDIRFDFVLRPGISYTRNATALMHKLNII
ncbi:MAG: hypothetical protein ABJH04_15815 [Cyclobacteriaceae bacterium]